MRRNLSYIYPPIEYDPNEPFPLKKSFILSPG